jgi:hypothetical protein
MSNHRYWGLIGVVGVVFGLASTQVHAQAPPEVESETPRQAQPSAPVQREDDAAAKALRSLYVPDGLTSDQAVKQVVLTSPDMKRTRALLRDAKGGALQAMSGLIPRLELLGRYSRLSPVDNPSFDIPTLGSLSFPSLTQQFASDATLALYLKSLV